MVTDADEPGSRGSSDPAEKRAVIYGILNRWTLGLDFGPRNAGLWTEISGNISAQKHTKLAAVLILDLCVSSANFVCF